MSIAAATAALNIRAISSGRAVASPEWEDLRQELRQLRVDLAHLRATNETLKEDLRKGRAEQKRLGKELEREKEERWRDRERDRERDRREEEREESPSPPTPHDASPARLRPRILRRVIVDSEEEMDVVGEMEEKLAHLPSPPVPSCRPKLGEIIPPAVRPPLKGVTAIIEPERCFEGPRPPPDAVLEGKPPEGPKPFSVDDIGTAMELLLPRLLAKMSITPPVSRERSAPLPAPGSGSVPSRGRTGAGEKGEGRPRAEKTPSTGQEAKPPQDPASSGANTAKKKKKKKGEKKGH